MDDIRAIDSTRTRLYRAGWHIGETTFNGATSTTWVVFGSNGENLILAFGPSHGEAWGEAERQAAELGLLDRPPGPASLVN